jgi:transposase-like protein
MPKSRALAMYTKTRRRWREEDAATVLAALDASGQSVAEFAERHGLDMQRLHFWRRRLCTARRPSKGRAPRFVEVLPRSSGHVEVVLRSGRTLRAAVWIDSVELRRLVEALEQDDAC